MTRNLGVELDVMSRSHGIEFIIADFAIPAPNQWHHKLEIAFKFTELFCVVTMAATEKFPNSSLVSVLGTSICLANNRRQQAM